MKLANHSRAVAALPTILFMSGIILEIAVVGAFLAYLYSSASYGTKLSAEALAAARAGAQDGILRVTRDVTYTNTGGYTVTSNSRNATVVVKSGYYLDAVSAGYTTITSTATAFTRQRKVRVVLGIDSTAGKADIVTYEETTI